MPDNEINFDNKITCTDCRYWRMCRFARNIYDAYAKERSTGWIAKWKLHEAIFISIANYCEEYIKKDEKDEWVTLENEA